MFLIHYGWWLVALLFVIAEFSSGTVYLLMVALGFAAGGVAELAGATATLQVLATVIVGIGGVGLWHMLRPRRARAFDAQRNPDVLLDIGAAIEVLAWHDGHARVSYRGSTWDATPENPLAPATGKLVIKAIHGSTLVLGPSS